MKYLILHVEGGLGKNIIATSLVRCLKTKFNDRKIIIVCSYPEVFLHNPNIHKIYKLGNTPYFYENYIKDHDTIILKKDPYHETKFFQKEKTLIDIWCESFDCSYDELNPEFFLNDIEKLNSNLLFNTIQDNRKTFLIQINGGLNGPNKSIPFNWYRDLPPIYANRLIEDFSKTVNFVQIRRPDQIQLNNTKQIDFSAREIFSILPYFDGAVCIDSFLQHAMASTDKKSMVFWIGNSEKVFGYKNNKNIKTEICFEECNPESYLDYYPIQSNFSYQCPKEYDIKNLFDYKKIKEDFSEMLEGQYK